MHGNANSALEERQVLRELKKRVDGSDGNCGRTGRREVINAWQLT